MTNREYSTGAVRSKDADSMAYDLISPIGLERVARTCREGEKKYGAYNWEKGMPIRDLLNHAIRHVFLYLSGDRSEDHLAHATWNLLGAIHSEEHWSDLNLKEENKLRKHNHDHTPVSPPMTKAVVTRGHPPKTYIHAYDKAFINQARTDT